MIFNKEKVVYKDEDYVYTSNSDGEIKRKKRKKNKLKKLLNDIDSYCLKMSCHKNRFIGFIFTFIQVGIPMLLGSLAIILFLRFLYIPFDMLNQYYLHKDLITVNKVLEDNSSPYNKEKDEFKDRNSESDVVKPFK